MFYSKYYMRKSIKKLECLHIFKIKISNIGFLSFLVKVDTQLEPISIVPQIENEWCSTHKRADNADIRISHIFLDFK